MDNMLLELFAKMMSGQMQSNGSGFNGNPQQFSQQNQNNPAYANYPREAFVQSSSEQSNNSLKSNNSNFNSPFNLNNLSSNENNILSLLLSLMSKGSNPLSSIMEFMSKKVPNEDKGTASQPKEEPIDDDILL